MSSPQSPDNQDDPAGADPSEPGPTEDVSEEDVSEEAVSEAVVKTTGCQNCGRRFVGDYCPNCGQEATPSGSTGSVIEDFAREFLDIEQGFLETVWALTTVPGGALRAYLNGDRAQLMSPGRYLLATLVIQYVVIQGLMWTGALVPIRQSSVAEQNGLLSADAPPVLIETVVTLFQFARSQKGQDRHVYRGGGPAGRDASASVSVSHRSLLRCPGPVELPRRACRTTRGDGPSCLGRPNPPAHW